ncbi:uncharacterized protein A4U43_C07F3490 [Asparagus officinalis]|uniref:Uncharacterized protein n=1 Tax=Asparagus officinalis TaxID=4686 RepID=A0A5P1ECE9_ASPOF|nr:uncharacterized protein A4U43_C07F3490 [Asparagus officinalis]
MIQKIMIIYGSDGSEVDFERSGYTSSEDDSDDDDFDPNDSNVDKSVPKYGSSSDESNFKSDFAKFCIELRKNLHAKNDSAPSVRNLKPIANSSEGTCTVDIYRCKILADAHFDFSSSFLMQINSWTNLKRKQYKCHWFTGFGGPVHYQHVEDVAFPIDFRFTGFGGPVHYQHVEDVAFPIVQFI